MQMSFKKCYSPFRYSRYNIVSDIIDTIKKGWINTATYVGRQIHINKYVDCCNFMIIHYLLIYYFWRTKLTSISDITE